jgi:hypothetical protein
MTEPYELEAFLMVCDLAHPPLDMKDDTLLYVGVVKTEEKSYVKKDVAFPTEKQLGYVGWACNLTHKERDEFQLTREECSRIIESHKANQTPMCKTELQTFLGRNIDLPPVHKQDDDYDDDIPF